MEAVATFGGNEQWRLPSLPAGKLYKGAHIGIVRGIAELRGACFLILSAHYGLIEPSLVIRPYTYRLTEADIAIKCNMVAGQLQSYDVQTVHFYGNACTFLYVELLSRAAYALQPKTIVQLKFHQIPDAAVL